MSDPVRRPLDIGIVGAGPAGAFCAERLARAGHVVCLYDPTHPREKPCGGGVTPGVFLRYPELGSLREEACATRAVRMRAPDGSELRVPLSAPIDVFSRRRLDFLLVERACKAGATLSPARVTRAQIDGEHAELEAGGRLRSHDFVIGADGPSSIVRRCLLGSKPGGPAGFATAGFHVDGLEERELYIEFVPEYKGYLWVFPRPDHVSAGVAAPLGVENGRELSQRVLAMLEARYPGSLEHPRRAYAASIPVASGRDARRPKLGGRRFALIGDAAALTDPITGEGIQHAIDSAAFLAAALDEAGPDDATALYARRWMAGPGRELARATQIAHWLYRPKGVDLALALGRRSRRARAIIGDMLTVLQPYSQLGRRLASDALRPPRS